MGGFIHGLGRCIVLTFAMLGLAGQTNAAPTPDIAKGVAWLQAQVRADGSLAGESISFATPLQARAEALTAFKLLATIPSSLVDSLAANTEDNTEYVARRVISSSLAGQGTDTGVITLLARQNSDGGFGGALEHESNPLDTAWAMLALNVASTNSSSAISAASSFLLASQDAGGGFSAPGNGSRPYLTALVMTALQVNSSSPATANSLNKATTWILSQQGVDGNWGGVAETSVVYLALLGSISDSGVQTAATAYLASQQGIDGSWGGDPCASALALRALTALPQPIPTSGNVMLHVVDSTTGEALAGVNAVIQGSGNAPAVSDGSGRILLVGVPAGSYAMTISADGYVTQSLSISLQAGTTTDLGIVKMSIATMTGILKGVVKDGSTGLGLADVTISVVGSANASTLTSSDGSYSLAGLVPGAVTVSASKTGYASVGGTATIVAGSILLFSPSLPLAGQSTGATGGIVGQVVDSASSAPLAGVTVMVGTGGITATSGADGKFGITGITAGTYPVSFSLGGYEARSIGAVLLNAGSVTDLEVVSLNKAIGTVSVAGKVTDLNSGQPLVGATVTILGSALSAVTDGSGNYHIDGLAPGSKTMRFSAVGYTSETVIRSFEGAGEFRVNYALRAGGGSTFSLTTLGSDQLHYGAYATATIRMEAQNIGTQATAGTVVIIVQDPVGKVLESVQATWVDSNGTVQRRFDFPIGVTAITVPWNTRAYAPGVYTIIAKVYQYSDSSPASGVVEIAEKQMSLTIDPTQALASVILTPLPAYSNLGATEQIGFKLDILNRSNVPITSELSYQLLTPSKMLVHGATAAIRLEAMEGSKSILIDGFPYTFGDSGLYPLTVAWVNGPIAAVYEGRAISVAPGTRIDPSQKIAPDIVTPDGDKRIRIEIRLQGVEQK